jgi:hypothetical protein
MFSSSETSPATKPDISELGRLPQRVKVVAEAVLNETPLPRAGGSSSKQAPNLVGLGMMENPAPYCGTRIASSTCTLTTSHGATTKHLPVHRSNLRADALKEGLHKSGRRTSLPQPKPFPPSSGLPLPGRQPPSHCTATERLPVHRSYLRPNASKMVCIREVAALAASKGWRHKEGYWTVVAGVNKSGILRDLVSLGMMKDSRPLWHQNSFQHLIRLNTSRYMERPPRYFIPTS